MSGRTVREFSVVASKFVPAAAFRPKSVSRLAARFPLKASYTRTLQTFSPSAVSHSREGQEETRGALEERARRPLIRDTLTKKGILSLGAGRRCACH